jgi:hypothetical protein
MNKTVADRIRANVAEKDALDEIVDKFWKYYVTAKMNAEIAIARQNNSRADTYDMFFDRYYIDDGRIWITSDPYHDSYESSLCVYFDETLLDDFEAFKKWADSWIKSDIHDAQIDTVYQEAVNEDRIRTEYTSLGLNSQHKTKYEGR